MWGMTAALPLPLPQSEEFAATCQALGRPLRRCKSEVGRRVRLWWQIQSHKIGVLGRIDLVSRGPVASEAGDLTDWTMRWQRWHDGRPLVLNADGLGPELLRSAGFWPLMTPASLALLPLGPEADMRAAMAQKWRNRLNRATREGLEVRETALTSNHWLLTAEAAQARARRYRGMPPGFSAAFAQVNPGAAQVFEARLRGVPVAAALMLRHGRMATWQIGVTTPEGRQRHAINLLLWRAMQSLAAQGHDCLDLGILNAQDAPGLAHFKLGTGAHTHRLGGTWLHLGALAPLARRLPRRFLQ
ncbi:acetyltransferase (GNAT) domain protein [Antarctobacter heliothermus]|uniref:Acetyltransferase (GNAT) domain protein n=2 Tax=Antarctobacter heliothermus TaxID=74033 RepID=A0A222E6Y9_9RHOB|nr:acetyltransferase (GNAT) domain protein [Antarctobacter heliothermus]